MTVVMGELIRYFITRPVTGCDSWFEVHDRESRLMVNEVVATFARLLPQAEEEAVGLCRRLNLRDA